MLILGFCVLYAMFILNKYTSQSDDCPIFTDKTQQSSSLVHLEETVSVCDNVGAELATEFELHQRSNVRHDNGHRDVEGMAVVCQSQCLIPCTCRYYAASRLLFLQSSYGMIFIHLLMTQQLHYSRAMTMSQNRNNMRKPGRKGR